MSIDYATRLRRLPVSAAAVAAGLPEARFVPRMAAPASGRGRSARSPTWYAWLEHGRGGAPSADVLNRIAKGLMLTEPEREHLFMLGLGHPPEVRYKAAEGVSLRLQRVLDAMEVSPAIVKTALCGMSWRGIAPLPRCSRTTVRWPRTSGIIFE